MSIELENWLMMAKAVGILAGKTTQDQSTHFYRSMQDLRRLQFERLAIRHFGTDMNVRLYHGDVQGVSGGQIWSGFAVFDASQTKCLKFIVAEHNMILVSLYEKMVAMNGPGSFMADFTVEAALRQYPWVRHKLTAINPLFATMPVRRTKSEPMPSSIMKPFV